MSFAAHFTSLICDNQIELTDTLYREHWETPKVELLEKIVDVAVIYLDSSASKEDQRGILNCYKLVRSDKPNNTKVGATTVLLDESLL